MTTADVPATMVDDERPNTELTAEDPHREIVPIGTIVRVQGLTDSTRELRAKHRTSIDRAKVLKYDPETDTYTVMPENDASGPRRPRSGVSPRALESTCTTGAEEVCSRSGVLDSREKKKRVQERQRADEVEAEAAKVGEEKERLKEVEKEVIMKKLEAEAQIKSAEAATAAVVRGDPLDPSLTMVGKAAAAAIDAATDRGQLERRHRAQLEIEEKKRETAEAKARALEAVALALEAAEKRSLALKNAMAQRARAAESENKKLKNAAAKAKANDVPADLATRALHRLPPAYRERLEAAHEETAEALDRVDELEIDLETLLEGSLGKNSGARIGADPTSRAAAATERPQLWEMLGKKNEKYSQDIIELGLTLMSTGLTSHQAVSVMRAFLRTEYPDKVEETKETPGDYRIPDPAR
jgi:hypothetical protein